MSRDLIYRRRSEAIKAFEFDQAVTAVFSDMISRSVPGYQDTLAGLHRLAPFIIPNGGRCYDLGCSLGAATLAVSMGLDQQNAELIGIDSSLAMIEQCRSDERFTERAQTLSFVHADIGDHSFDNANLVIMNYTLQFLPPNDREALLRRIYDGLLPGGALVISEKFSFQDPVIQDMLTTQHLHFKRQNDYSDLEIAGKRAALEDVLISDTREQHLDRLKAAGFEHVVLWLANLNFGSFLAIKRAS